jgi:hypothetical protein
LRHIRASDGIESAEIDEADESTMVTSESARGTSYSSSGLPSSHTTIDERRHASPLSSRSLGRNLAYADFFSQKHCLFTKKYN